MSAVALNLIPYIVMVMWLVGGQIVKGVRRFGIPGLTSLVVVWRILSSKDKSERKYWPAAFIFLLLIPILAMGYGVNSWLMKIFKNDLTVRIAYGILVCIPIAVYAVVTPGTPMWKMLPIVAAITAAFQVRAGSLFKIGRYDVLIEDIVRSLTAGYSIVWIVS